MLRSVNKCSSVRNNTGGVVPHLGSESRSPGPRVSAGCCQFGQFLIIIADLEHGALGGAGVPRGSGSDHSPEAAESAGKRLSSKRARFSVFHDQESVGLNWHLKHGSGSSSLSLPRY